MIQLDRTLEGFELDAEKLEQAILFFVTRSTDDGLLTTKLMTLLYFADFDHFERYDVPITGSIYVKLKHGPAPHDANVSLSRMCHRKMIAITTVRTGENELHQITTQLVPNMAVFEPNERAILEQTVVEYMPHSGEELGAMAHNEEPWIAVAAYEQIPYYLAYYRNKYGEMRLDDDELGVADEAGELVAVG